MKTRVCIDADVLIAGFFSRRGASFAILALAEIGLLEAVIPEAAKAETRRNLLAKLPAAVPFFDQFLEAAAVRIYQPRAADLRRAKALAHEKDVAIMAAALGSGSGALVTHNTRHFRSTEAVRVLRPRDLMEKVRAWMAGQGH